MQDDTSHKHETPLTAEMKSSSQIKLAQIRIAKAVFVAIALMLLAGVTANAQRSKRGQRGNQPQQRASTNEKQTRGEMVDNLLDIGDSGVAWYTTWKTGLAEAKRSNRPIFFMSAATTCSGVPGVF